ncbi:MAG TPA: hypothetical protein VKE51_23200 [Vicinamibacterales bacterium]|nr:hypothetical protein [Vicinamibacterales bacterium]
MLTLSDVFSQQYVSERRDFDGFAYDDSWPLPTHRSRRHAFAIRCPRFTSERSLIVHGASLQDVLGALCDGIDARDPDVIPSVLLGKKGHLAGMPFVRRAASDPSVDFTHVGRTTP